MTILQIVLIVIIIPITLLNIRFITTGRRKKEEAKAKYSRMLSILLKNEESLGGAGSYTAAKYVADNGDNYLICRSKNENIGAIVTESEFHLLSPLSTYYAVIETEEDETRWNRIVLCVNSDDGAPIRITIASSPHKKKYMGKYLMETAIDAKDEIERRDNN